MVRRRVGVSPGSRLFAPAVAMKAPFGVHALIILLSLSKVSPTSPTNGSFTCLSCKSAVLPKDCETIARCGPSEDCFADVYATALGYLRFDLGCRDTQYVQCFDCLQQCIGSHSQKKRYSGTDKLLQSFCCSGNLCNQQAGTVTGYTTPRGPVCFECSEQAHYDSCNRIRVCGQNEKCVIRSKANHPGMFETGCERDTVCSAALVASSLLGKRNTDPGHLGRESTCNECCSDDLCNDKCVHQGVNLSPCAARPCINGGCFEKGENYVCQCYPGYSGSRCENKDLADQCLSNPCAYGTCHNYGDYYACSCQPGYTGVNCDRFVVVDHCSPNPCIHGNCSNTSRGFRCTCTLGYTGVNCDKFVASSDHCSPSPCIHGNCTNTAQGFWCTCTLGYTGVNCENVLVDHCAPNPCLHGYCTNTLQGYQCTCHSGYTGMTCDSPVDHCAVDLCVHGKCFPNGADYSCACIAGYTGKLCDRVQTVDPCLSNPCLNGHCVSSKSNFSCTCNVGFTGNTCETPVSLDPCNHNPCVHGSCHPGNDTATSFVCKCDVLKTGKHCDQDCPDVPPNCKQGVLCFSFDESFCKVCKDECIIKKK